MRKVSTHRKKQKETVYINVAPLVDVMIVLMLIFMMTSQISTVGVQVNLPRTTAAKTTEDQNTPIVITIDQNEKIYLEEAAITLEDLLNKLPLILQKSKSDTVYIRGDKGLNYGKLMEIMGVISKSGIAKVSLIGEAER